MIHEYPANNDLDVALREVRTPGDTIKLRPGSTFTTRGAWAFCDGENVLPGLAPGVTLDARDCVIELADDAERTTNGQPRPEHDLQFPWLGDGAIVFGGKWKLGGDTGRHLGWALSGFHAMGDVILDGVQLIGQRGTKGGLGYVKESFALTQAAGGDATIIHCKVSDSDTTREADSYVSGWYPCNGLVDNTQALYGETGWFAFSNHGNCKFKNCEGRAQYIWYTDTGGAETELASCDGEGFCAAVGVRQAGKRTIVVHDTKAKAGRIVEWSVGANEGSVTVIDCLIESEYGAAIDAAQGNITFVNTKGWQKHYITPGSFNPVELNK